MQVRNYTEAEFQADMRKWIPLNIKETLCIEYKVSDTGTIGFDRLEPHQLSGLLNASEGTLYFKPMDDTSQRKPFDAFHIVKSLAYVAVMFNCKVWGNKTFYLITPQAWEKEQFEGANRTLSEERANQIGSKQTL